MTASTTSTSTPATNNSKKAATTKPAPRVAPWVDLPANPEMQKEPRDKTVLACALKLLRERGREGASLAEIKSCFKEINLEHHDPKALLVWASKNRGWGFHMKQNTDKIVLVTK